MVAKFRHSVCCVALSLALSLNGPVALGFMGTQQSTTITDALTGRNFKLTLKMDELTDSYNAAIIQTSGGSNIMDLYSMSYRPDGSQLGLDPATLMKLASVSWSTGDVVQVDKREFLVTYRLEFLSQKPGAQASDVPSEFAKDEFWVPDAPAQVAPILRMKLISTAQIVSIEPHPEMKAAELRAKFAKPTTTGLRSQTVENAKQIAVGVAIYSSDYDDKLPRGEDTATVRKVTMPYLKNLQVWNTMNPARSKFNFNMAITGVSASAIERPAETILFYESAAWDDGKRVVAFVDSHVQIVDEATWNRIKGSLLLKLKK